MKIGLLNNTIGKGLHPGCRLTMHCFHTILKKYGEVLDDGKINNLKVIEDSDVVIINGEGNTHDYDTHNGFKRIMDLGQYAHKLGKPVYLVNCVAQNIPEVIINTMGDIFQQITVRDKNSYEYLSSFITHKVHLIPDICFAYNYKIKDTERKGVLYSDGFSREKTNKMKSYCIDRPWIDFYPNSIKPIDMLKTINNYEMFVTGRYHGVVFALITGTPFYFMPSNTWKIEGLVRMLDIPDKDLTQIYQLYTVFSDCLYKVPSVAPFNKTIKDFYDTLFSI